MTLKQKIAVVIPTYKARNHIVTVLSEIGAEVATIYVVDDACPENSGDFVASSCQDERIKILRLEKNKGVGGAVMAGYRAAIDDGNDIIVKIDSDGQMDPSLILDFVMPIIDGDADYTKGNRFFDLEKVQSMPKIRLIGNAVLSLMSKISSGYWNIFDPTNGYTAIHASVANRLPFEKISDRYFFETDMLFRLNTLRALVVDIPMEAKYGDEVSHLKVSKIITEFLLKHCRNFIKRIFYNYYLRDMSLASILLPLGLLSLLFGGAYGIYQWIQSSQVGVATTAGTVMLSALPIIAALQFLLGFISYDMSAIPTRVIHKSSLLSTRKGTNSC
mgnify:CR=1 FL=1